MSNFLNIRYNFDFVITVCLTNLMCLTLFHFFHFDKAHALELGIGAAKYQHVKSDTDFYQTGSSLYLDFTLIFPITDKKYSFYFNGGGQFLKQTKVLPFNLAVGGIYYGRALSKTTIPYLNLELGYLEGDFSNTSCYQTTDNQPLGCIRKFISLSSALGIRIEFNHLIYLFFEINVFNELLYALEKYDTKETVTQKGFGFKSISSNNALQRVSAGFIFKL